MTYASATAVADRLGRDLTESEARIVSTRLADAEELIKSRIPDLDTKVTAGAISEDLVILVEAEAVLRLVRNPDGYKAETDGNYSYEIDQRVASGRLMILDEEWSWLGIRASVYTISPVLDLSHLEPWWRKDWYEGPEETAVWA